MPKEGFVSVEIPIIESEVTALIEKVYLKVVQKVAGLHPGIPSNQLASIVSWIVVEILYLTGDMEREKDV